MSINAQADNNLSDAGPSQSSTMVSLGQGNIQDMYLNNDGELVIKFSSGGVKSTLVIEDVAALAQDGAKLPLPNGDVLDIQAVYAELSGEGDTSGGAQDMVAMNEIAEQLAAIEPGADESFEFAANETVSQSDIPDVFKLKPPSEEAKESDPAPESEMAAMADNLAEVEPAAGEGSGSSDASGSSDGYGFQSGFEAQGVIGLEDVGPIDPTQLQYGIERKIDELYIEEEEGGNTPPPEKPQNFMPSIFNTKAVLDETDGFSLNKSGTLVFDFGGDGAGLIAATGIHSASGSMSGGTLKSGGHDVTISSGPAGYTGSTVTGQIVFTLTIDPQSGEYVYNQNLPFDHADGSDNDDTITLNFGVQIADSNGDVAQSNIEIRVHDDGPKDIQAQGQSVDETDLGTAAASVTGQITADFGQDGAGNITGNGDFLTNSLTSNGAPVFVTYDPASATYTAMASGDVIFTLRIDANGSYDFELLGTLDHPDTTDPNDALALVFGIRASDFDGDSLNGTLTIKVLDDGPVAKDDCVSFDTADNSVSGNVVANDDLSQDVANMVTEVSFKGLSVNVPFVGSTFIDGDFGVLEIKANGAYTYTLNGGVSGSTQSQNALNPAAADVAGQQSLLSKDGITVSVANSGNYDLVWLDTSDGSGIGIDNLNQGDSQKVWPQGETFKIALDEKADSVTLTIAEIGSNNNQGNHGVDFTITLEDGSTVTGEQQFVPSEIIDGTFEFTLNSADFNGLAITSIALNSTNDGQYEGASFLLNNVVAERGSSVEICDMFQYTLTDADGDSSVATLKIKGLEPVLIVGENVDDTSSSGVPHHIGDEGVIGGGLVGDVLVGDVGGASLEQQTQDYNFVFIIDVSGSMGSAKDSSSQIALLKNAVSNLLNEFGSYQNGDIKVHIVPFSTNAKPSGTFTVTNAAELTASLDYLSNFTGDGYTNYESPLQGANTWLQSGGPIGGDAITTTYFISDGEPNRYLNDSGNVQSGNASIVVSQITGSDGSDEVSMLHTLSDEVIAVGVNASSGMMGHLNVIDSDGNALNINDASDLSVVFKDTSPLNNLAQVGGDVIEGGSGDDIIFGDSVNTDALADDHNLGTPDGAGWLAFDKLEAGESASDPSWSREDTVEYVRNNHEALAEESKDSGGDGRQGGNDIISGGAGDDIIYGQEGDDIISGDEGSDIIYGGSGADTFVQNVIGMGVDVIRDFSAGEGDVLDLSGLIQNYDPTQKAIDDFVFSREVGGGTILSVDVSGSGNAANAVDLVALEGVLNIDLQAMFEDGTINVM